MSAQRQIIVIMTDTQRTDWLGCYGYRLRTRRSEMRYTTACLTG